MTTKRAKALTAGIMIVTVAIWIAWDIYIYASVGPAATESNLLMEFGSAHPSLPALVGILMGHFWWPVKKRIDFKQLRTVILFVYCGSLIFLDAFQYIPAMYPLYPFLVNIPAGRLLFPLKSDL